MVNSTTVERVSMSNFLVESSQVRFMSVLLVTSLSASVRIGQISFPMQAHVVPCAWWAHNVGRFPCNIQGLPMFNLDINHSESNISTQEGIESGPLDALSQGDINLGCNADYGPTQEPQMNRLCAVNYHQRTESARRSSSLPNATYLLQESVVPDAASV